MPTTSTPIQPLNLENPLPQLSEELALHLNAPVAHLGAQIRLIRLDEINEERHQTYQQALANVYASMDCTQAARLLYLLDGSPDGVHLYFGVVADSPDTDLHQAIQNLRGALEGQLPGINFGEEIGGSRKAALLERLGRSRRQGVLLGTPTLDEQTPHGDAPNFQDIDRLVRALQSGGDSSSDSWQLTVISQPLTRPQIRQQLQAAYALSSQLSAHISTNVQASGNASRQSGTSSGQSEARGSSQSTTQTDGSSESDTTGDNKSDTRGKNNGGSEGKNEGKSSGSSSTGNSQDKNWGTSESRTTGTSTSHTKGTNTSTSHADSLSLTRTSNDGSSQSRTTGHTLGISKELTDKHAQHLVDYLDKQLIARLQKGLTKGLFHTAVYLSAENGALYQRLKHTACATFQGNASTLAPLQVHDLPAALPTGTPTPLLHLPTLAPAQAPSPEALLLHSLHSHTDAGTPPRLGSLMTADELAVVASLPQHELQGIRRRRAVEFIVDLPDTEAHTALTLGCVIDRGRRYPNNPVRLARHDLNKHVFITGVTGAGKTTTCLNLLLESRLPFLVIEPAKTEYRELAARLPDIDYYRPNGDDHQSLRINPFALVRKGQRIKSHAGFLKNVFAAVFPMEASMPAMVEDAILTAYEAKGWDVDDNQFLPPASDCPDSFDPAARAWPTMSDMIAQLDRLIPTYGLGKEFEEKYRGSLVSRLRSLTDGTLGQVLDVPQSLSFDALLDRRAVIELEELQGGEEKALLMALLLGGINEAIRARFAREPGFRHLTLIEEAHRLLARPEPGDKATALAVEAFADMLAEVRKYGEGLIIADQIPAKLIPDIIKNTHTKIVHRLFAEDDRRAMGEAMMMDDEQRAFLPNLKTGEAIVFCGGWHGAAHAAIRHDHAQTDNHAAATFDLHARTTEQLWRERHRYYPQFCRLGWLSVNAEDAPTLARFVRETRQAQKQLLRFIAPDTRTSHALHAQAALARLQQWHHHWQPLAQAGQTDLAHAWTALLLDANPRPHTSEKDVPPLLASDFLTQASHTLMDVLAQSDTVQDWMQHKNTPRCADLREHLDHLGRFKSI